MADDGVGSVGEIVVSEALRQQAQDLARNGFVNVTNLPMIDMKKEVDYYKRLGALPLEIVLGVKEEDDPKPERPEPEIIRARKEQWGCHGHNKVWTFLVTLHGQVWVAFGSFPKSSAVFSAYAPKSGASITCFDGKSIPMDLMMERIRYPYSDCGGRYPPIPQD